MRYAVQKIEALKKELDRIPPAADGAVETSLLGAIRMLAPRLERMRTRGHRMDALVKHLGERGVTIKPNTLKAYLQRISVSKAASKRGNTGAGAGEPRDAKAHASNTEANGKPTTPAPNEGTPRVEAITAGQNAPDASGDWQEPEPTDKC